MKIDGAILEIRSSPDVGAAEDLDQADGDVFVMEETAVETEPTVTEIGIADETRGGVALVAEEFGERGERGVERAIGTGGKLVRPASGEHTGVGGKRPGGGGACAVESHSALCEFCQVGRSVAVVAVEAQAFGTTVSSTMNSTFGDPAGAGARRCSSNFSRPWPKQASSGRQRQECRQAESHETISACRAGPGAEL